MPEVFMHFKYFKVFVENKFMRIIFILRFDGGKEYCNNQFVEFLQLHGIAYQHSCTYTP